MSFYEYSDYSYYYNDFSVVPDMPCPEDFTIAGNISFSTVINDTEAEGSYCNSSYDSFVCWPVTKVDHLATVPCPDHYNGIPLNTEGSATKFCNKNGTWQARANYNQCLLEQQDELHYYIVRVIFHVGYTLSTIALVFALLLFFYFRSLWCLRNSIHCHLMVTFVLKNLLWIIMHNTLPLLTKNTETEKLHVTSAWTCKLLVASFNYVQSASFFWMQVEGVYLLTMIVWTYSADKVRMWKYALFGWGGPFLTVMTWAIVKATLDSKSCCCWLPKKNTYWDYIYIAPVLAILLINIFILVSIEYVLFTKLKANNSLATRQYKKAAKGTVILFPLLGVIYVLLITEPGSNPTSKKIFLYFNAILQSVQGLFVAIFYCFLNGEVRNVIKNRFGRWKEQRTVGSIYWRHSRNSYRGNDMISHGNETQQISLRTQTSKLTSTSTTPENQRQYISLHGDSYYDKETGESETDNNSVSNSKKKCEDNGVISNSHLASKSEDLACSEI